MAPILGGSGQLDPDEQSSVQAKSLIDFEVTSIEIGTGSVSAMEWSQPDGSIEEYVIRGQEIQIEVTFTQAGTSSPVSYTHLTLPTNREV